MYLPQNCSFDNGIWLDPTLKSDPESLLQTPMLLATSFFPLAEPVDSSYFCPMGDFDQSSGLSSPSSSSSSSSFLSLSPSSSFSSPMNQFDTFLLGYQNIDSFSPQHVDIQPIFPPTMPTMPALPAFPTMPTLSTFSTQSTLPIKPKKQVKSFYCHLCLRSFARKHDLQRHVRVHTGAKPYPCLSCNKAFARTDALKRHLRLEESCKSSSIIQAMKKSGNRRYQDL